MNTQATRRTPNGNNNNNNNDDNDNADSLDREALRIATELKRAREQLK